MTTPPPHASAGTIAHQSVAQLGGRMSVLNRQRRDHVELDRLLHRLEDASTRDDEDAVLRSIYRLVFPHAFAEEVVLWPVMRRVLPDGEALTLQVEAEHQEVNQLVRDLELEPTSPERPARLARLVEVLREDVRDEEDELLPRLQERLDRRQLQALGAAWEVVRHVSPTRTHPVVSRRPPGNALSGLPLAALDRLRDASAAADQRWGPTRVLPAADHRLAQASRRLETMKPFRVGERSTTASSGPAGGPRG